MFQLRGHHLFCLLGYRGMGYSKEYVENMTKMQQTLRINGRTMIQLINGPDQLCEKYPNSGECHCEESRIYERDAVILEKLKLKVGQILPWEDIESQIRAHIVPSDIETMCETCSWRSYGFCEEGVSEVLKGKSLREVNYLP